MGDRLAEAVDDVDGEEAPEGVMPSGVAVAISAVSVGSLLAKLVTEPRALVVHVSCVAAGESLESSDGAT